MTPGAAPQRRISARTLGRHGHLTGHLVVLEFGRLSPYFAGSNGTYAGFFVSAALQSISVAYGIYSGLRLWQVRPNAVGTAKKALLLGLAVDVIVAFISEAVDPTRSAQSQVLRQVLLHVAPGLVFFTVCFAYLDRSSRVASTYRVKVG